MLHNETRELLVEGYERTHNAKGIAAAYGVSERMVYRLIKQKRETGSVTLRTSERGRKPLLSEEDKQHIAQEIDEQPDITIEELREKLHLNASYPTVARAIKNMGYTMKKKSLHASEQERLRCPGKTYTVERTRGSGGESGFSG